MAEEKTIFKVYLKKKPFVQIDKKTVEDKNLSWKARGLLIFLLSRPDNWKIYLKQLEKESKKDGRDSLRSGLKELEERGYLVKEQLKDKKGRFQGYRYLVFETLELGKAILGKSIYGKPAPTNKDSTNEHINSLSKDNNKDNDNYPQRSLRSRLSLEELAHLSGFKQKSPVQQVIAYWIKLVKDNFGTEPYINWGKDGKLIKSVIKRIGIENTKKVLDWYIDSERFDRYGPNISAALSSYSINLWKGDNEVYR